MTSDYSRSTFNRRKHYSAVRMQQGRVQMDADWNEQVDIQAHHQRERTRDLIGPSGAPVDGAGFALHVERLEGGAEEAPRHRLVIGAGRYYLDGVLCENETPVPLESQPDSPGEPPPSHPGVYLAVLDVWERTLTAYEAPEIREVALGGPDTAVRTKMVWQVRTLKVGEDPDAPDRGHSDEAWRRFLSRQARTGEMRAQRKPGVATELPGNQLYRVEVQEAGECAGGALEHAGHWPHLEVEAVEGDAAALHVRHPHHVDWSLWRPGRFVEVVAEHGRHVAKLTQVDAAKGRLELSSALPSGRGAPQRLRPIASFKWSRNNGSQVLPIASVQGTPERPQVRLAAPVGTRGVDLRVGDVVEAVDSRLVLRGEPGPLRRILSVAEDRQGVTLDGPLPEGLGQSTQDHPLLRRWDQTPAVPCPLAVDSKWVELEHGVQVQFTGHGLYHPGDFWMMAARTRTGDVEWPRDEQQQPLPQRPHGGEHRYTQLALVRMDARGHLGVEDRRILFAPLSRGGAQPDEPKGPVTFPDDVRVLGSLRVDAELDAGSIRGQLAHGTVGTHQLQHESVTSNKLAHGVVHARHLAPEVGMVPPGSCILSESPQPPSGYESSHLTVSVFDHHAQWVERAALPVTPGRGVLVMLGHVAYALLDSGQVWRCHGEAESWELVGHMPEPQPGFTAVAVDHRIHVLGGRDAQGRPLARHLAFEPPGTGETAGHWTQLRPLPTPRDEPGAVAADGLLFVLGGVECWPLPWWGAESKLHRPTLLSWLKHSSARVEVYDPRLDTWGVARKMPEAGSRFGVAALRGRLHVVAGERKRLLLPTRPLARHSQFDPLTQRWNKLAPLERPRSEVAAAAVDDRLYVVGGSYSGQPLDDVERYSFTSDAWLPQEPLPEPLRGTAAVMLPGELLVTGGANASGPLSTSHSLEVAALLYVHRKLEAHATQARPVPQPEQPTTPSSSAEAPPASTPELPASTPAPSGPRVAARSGSRHRNFRPPSFTPAPSTAKRLGTLAVRTLAVAALGGGAGVVWPRLSQPSQPTRQLESMPKGFDISHFQAEVDWPAVLKNKPAFAFVKATEGETLLDPRFQDNWSALADAGVRRGAYHFFRPQDSASAQADFFLKTVKLEPGDLPPVLDVEVTDAVKGAELISGVSTWLAKVEQATKRKPIVYSYTSFWREHLDGGFQDYPLWMTGQADGGDPWTFWQVGDQGEVDGITGCVDQDVFLGSAEEFEAFVMTGARPAPGTATWPTLPTCARPTQSNETPVPVRVADGGTPSRPDAGTPVADAGTSQVVPYQEGMTPDPPFLVHPGEPLVYPEKALLQGTQGEAIVMCTIQTNGTVTNCRVIKSLPGLDDALIQMMSTRRYQPMKFQGRVVAVEYPFYLHVKLPPGYEMR